MGIWRWLGLAILGPAGGGPVSAEVGQQFVPAARRGSTTTTRTSRGRPSIARTLATSHIAQSDAGIAKYEEDSSIISTSRRESAALVYSQSGFAISKLATAAILLIVY